MAKGLFGKNSTSTIKYIEDIEDLNAVRLLPKSGPSYDLILANDINMNVYPYNQKEGWEPLPILYGNFDGQNHTIFNLYINRPKEDNVGLFRQVNNLDSVSHYIKNVFLDNVNITGKNNVGALIGLADMYGIQMNNIIVSGKINGNNKVAGLVGFSQPKISSGISNTFVDINIESNKGNVDALTTGGTNIRLLYSACFVKYKIYEDSQVETNSYSSDTSVWYNTDYIKGISYKGSRPSGKTTSEFLSGELALPCSNIKRFINVRRGEFPKYNKYHNIKYVMKIEDSYCMWDNDNNVWVKKYGEDVSELDIVKIGYDKVQLENVPKAAYKQLKGKNVSLIAVVPQLNGFKTINTSRLITYDKDFDENNHQDTKFVLKKTFSYAEFNDEMCNISTL